MRYKTDEAQRGQPDNGGFNLARFLGIFSLLLGLTELVAAGPIAHALGMAGHKWVILLYGAREILAGVLVLASKDPTPWIWFRFAGDILDLATVGYAYARLPAPVMNVIITLIFLLGATALDLYCAARLSRDSKDPQAPPRDYSSRTGTV